MRSVAMERRDQVPADQVPRWQQFAQDHPEIEVASPVITRGMWKAYRGYECISVQLDLRRLLDDLEDKLGENQ